MTNNGSMSAFRRPSAPGKMMMVNDAFGNPTIKDQQSTTRELYHALPLDGRQTFEFFKNVGAGTGLTGETGLPFNNISENKLQVGESLVVQRLRFEVINLDPDDGTVTSIVTITAAGLLMLYGGDWSFFFDTQEVSKPNPLTSQLPAFNRNAWFATNEWIELDNDSVQLTDIQFKYILQVPAYTPAANARLRCVVSGFGSLFAAKGQF